MADLSNKENLSPQRLDLSPVKFQPISPLKTNRRGRSKSIGADGISNSPKKSSPTKDRRKSMFAPAPKSILPSKQDEAKRREARRKSLANRRVSFAPEATLHTWDVIEYIREATTSSTTFEDSRRASQSSENEYSDLPEVPATPDGNSTFPARQAKSRRRSSAIPPLNFNDPDEYLSSSPAGGSSPADGSEDDSGADSADDLEEDDDDTAMSMVSVENTGDFTMQSNASAGTTDSSLRLEASLRLAAEQAGTRGIHYDEFGDQPAQEDVVEEALPWTQQGAMLTPMAKNLMAIQDQENVNPFSPMFRAHAASGRPSTIAEEDEDEMSMDMEMTRAIGGILGSKQHESSTEDMTMDFTHIGGRIYQNSPIKAAMKRRRSTTNEGSPMTAGILRKEEHENHVPANKRRRSSGEEELASLDDGTMDFTTAFGAINEPVSQNATMEFTTAIGNILRKSSPIKASRRQSVRRRRSSVQSAKSMDETMDFTTAFGGIQTRQKLLPETMTVPAVEEKDEDMSMELTGVIGQVLAANQTPDQPSTPNIAQTPPKTDVPTTPKDQDRFNEAQDMSAKKLLTPALFQQKEAEIQSSPFQAVTNSSPRKILVPKSRRSASPVKAPTNATPVRPQGPFADLMRKSPDAARAGDVDVKPTTPPALSSAVFMEQPPIPKTPTPVTENPSPEKAVEALPMCDLAPRSHSPERTQTNMLDNIRSMSTPRKDSNASPLKRLKEMTPKKTPGTTTKATRSAMPSSVRFAPDEETANIVDEATQQLNNEVFQTQSSSAIKPASIKLSDFLSAAGIKFMDLTTTKRRYTAAPTPAKAARAQVAQDAEDSADAGKMFEEAVAVGACAIPELDLYQHSCRELKRYISEGKTFLKQLESDVSSAPPAFVSAYMTAEPAARARLDVHMTDMKTRARLQSKQIWYNWRSQLLKGLEDGLRNIEAGLEQDEVDLTRRNAMLLDVLPAALERQELLEHELSNLEAAAALYEHEDKEELALVRAQLLEADAAFAQRQADMQRLQAELNEQERLVELYTDGKNETIAAIEEAKRVKEACRGVSNEEVAAHQATLSALETSTGWRVTAAEGSSLTVVYRSALQLFFHPQPDTNRPISLTYTADDAESLTTEKRFFLQLMRAQLQMLDQPQTSIRSLLHFVSSGWDTTASIAETIRRLTLEERVAVSILSDEKLGVTVDMLLPAVQTKVQLAFEITASIEQDSEDDMGSEIKLKTAVDVKGRVVYGEQYKEGKMGEFVGQRLGGVGIEDAEVAVRELRGRLEKTGRKG